MAESTIPVLPLGSDTAGTITTQNLTPTAGATANSSVSLRTGGRDTLIVQITGTYTGALSIQGTVDDTTWVTLGGASLIVNVATATTASTIASGAVGIYQVGVTGLSAIRVTALAAVTGTANVTLRAADGNAAVTFNGSLPAGTAAIGAVTATPGTGTAYTLVTATTTNIAVIKASSGSLYELTISNVTAATIFVKLYNKATAATLASDIPAVTIPVTAGATYTNNFGAVGKRFTNGLGIAVTAAATATDTTAVTAGAQVSATYL